jgi:hypothetical protein
MGRVQTNLVRFLKGEVGSATAAGSALAVLIAILCLVAATAFAPTAGPPPVSKVTTMTHTGVAD